MRLANDGLTLWYATPDAPAPLEEGARREGTLLTIGTQPPSPANAVTIHYRVDGGPVSVLPARETGTDYTRQVQYFRATFPPFGRGHVVEYRPELTCGGRQVPSYAAMPRYPSRFKLADPELTQQSVSTEPTRSQDSPHRFGPRLDFAAAVTTRFSQYPSIIGETPLGMRVNYYLEDGTIVGPKLNGRVLKSGGDFLLVRRDGIGVVQVNAVFQTSDGAMLGADYYGIVDLGPDGYQRAVRGELAAVAPLRLAPRFMTGDARYSWVNRSQFAGVGQVLTNQGMVEYDLFVLDGEPQSTV